MPELPPERPKCSKRFGQPRNHSVFRMSPPPAGEASVSPKETESKDQKHAEKRPDVPEHNREGRINWTTWVMRAHSSCRNSSKQNVPRQARLLSFLWISIPMLSNWRFPLIPLLWSKLNSATNMATDDKMLVNALYHSAVVSGLAIV